MDPLKWADMREKHSCRSNVAPTGTAEDDLF